MKMSKNIGRTDWTGQERKILKECERKIALYRTEVTTLKDRDGVMVTHSRGRGVGVCKDFYTNLFDSSMPVDPPSFDGRTE